MCALNEGFFSDHRDGHGNSSVQFYRCHSGSLQYMGKINRDDEEGEIDYNNHPLHPRSATGSYGMKNLYE